MSLTYKQHAQITMACVCDAKRPRNERCTKRIARCRPSMQLACDISQGKRRRTTPTPVELGAKKVAAEQGARVAGLSLRAINLLSRLLAHVDLVPQGIIVARMGPLRDFNDAAEAVGGCLDEARRLIAEFDKLSKLGRKS